ncbi:hypothetical protein Cgig2_017699 [Carnegiea gigantea]|uniref:Uncharacterized protein n=1 Tax=Carnegiea gigantea TaxID=171969 RepID=A0A9Q1GFR2_9CARY|nr:hypothetical protein Cgig2_017699 [Carnegiea gigantea]
MQAMTQRNTILVTQPDAWNPSCYQLRMLHMSEQYIHCNAMQMSTNVKFYIIIGGGDVLVSDIRDMRDFMESCELQEMRCIGPYYSWTNKTIMSRIDHVLINDVWNDLYDANSLSDHIPLVVQFLQSPKPKMRFQYCDMWAKHADFSSIISSAKPTPSGSFTLITSGDSFDDLKEQQELARVQLSQIQQELQANPHREDLICKEKVVRVRYVNILYFSSSLDTSSKIFYAKAKQCKLATYIYSINDANGNWVEGFDDVGKVMVEFYKRLLGH